jgi:hypothetical protein
MAMKVRAMPARGARRAAQGVGDKRAEKFQHPARPASEDAGRPDKIGILRLLPERTHDQKDVGHETDGVDAERQSGDIVAPRTVGQTVGLPGVKKVSEKNGDGRGGEDPGNDDLEGNSADRRDQGKNQKELEEVIDEEADEAVQISTNEPAGFHRIRLR